MSLASQISALATRIAGEFKTVRGEKVSKSGDTMTGALTAPDFTSYRTTGAFTNQSIQPNTGYVTQAPFAPLWHDLLAFNRGLGTPKFETYDGTTWTVGTSDNRMFSMKENQNISVVNGTTQKAGRWTWSSTVGWSTGTWLILGHAYNASPANKQILVESSTDGVTWTTRHTSTGAWNQVPVWYFVNSYGGDSQVRLTITWLSGGPVVLSSIRLLSSRWGDQGRGKEFEYPYTWDENQRMGIMSNIDANAALTVGGSVKLTSGTVYNLAAPVNPTDATTKAYVDGIGNSAGTPSTIVRRDSNGWFSAIGISGLSDPTQPNHASTKRYVDDGLAGKADDTKVVHTTGDETVAGVKTFSNTPVTTVTTPTAANHLTRKDYVDNGLAGKANSTHSHATSDVTGLDTALSGKAAAVHGHTISDVSGLQTALDGKQAAGSYAPADHDHVIADLTATGTPDSSTFLRGDGTWAAPDSGALTGLVDVKAAGAVGDGVTDDSAAIQAAIDGSAEGDTIWFPAGDYLIGTTIRLKPYRVYEGAGGRSALTNLIAAPGLTGNPLMAAEGWWNNGTGCDNPIRVTGIYFDGAGVTKVHGLVVYNYWSHFEDLQFGALDGADTYGIVATDTGRDGTTVTNNSHSENTFVRLRFHDTSNGAGGFFSESKNGISNQDGHLTDSFFAGIAGSGIVIGRAAGWTIENNHLYGIGYSGIQLSSCYATKVIGNYVEDFGGEDAANPGAPTYGYYNGIALETVLDTRATVVVGNTVSTAQPLAPTGNRWVCFYARAGSGQLKANAVFSGNTAVWARGTAPTTSKSDAFRFGEGGDTGRMLNVEWSGNQIENSTYWVNTRKVYVATVTVKDPTNNVRSAGSGTSLSIDASIGSTSVDYTATGNAAVNVPTNGQNGQVVQLAILASGAARTITFDAGIDRLTGISASYTPASGKLLRAALRYSTLTGKWTVEAAAVTQ